MKLCRFVLNDAPEHARSGVYHDGKVYETDGERAIGIHEPGKISLLPPLGTPPAARVFIEYRRPDGDVGLTYRFQNVASIAGPNGEVAMPPALIGLDFDLHVVGVVSEKAESVERHEGASFVLGYALMIVLYDPEMADQERALGLPMGPVYDVGGALGPFLTTPEDLAEFTVGTDTTSFEWRYRIKVNDAEVATGVQTGEPAFAELLHIVSDRRPIFPGEVLAWPAIKKPLLSDSPLGRPLIETDRIEAVVDGLGTLVVRIA